MALQVNRIGHIDLEHDVLTGSDGSSRMLADVAKSAYGRKSKIEDSTSIYCLAIDYGWGYHDGVTISGEFFPLLCMSVNAENTWTCALPCLQ